MKTKHKILLASMLSKPFIWGYKAVGKRQPIQASRAGLKWELDLAEGLDFSIYLFGAVEPRTINLYKKLVKSDDVIFDIGANIGAHSIFLASLVGERGHVHSFEPTSFAINKLNKNLALNPELKDRITVNQAMVTEKVGEKIGNSFYSSWPIQKKGGKDEIMHEEHCGVAMDASQAEAVTLDAYAEDHEITKLSLVKIDVDGFENVVMKGGIKTLEKFKPIIVAELAPYTHEEHGYSFEEYIQYYKSLGYRLYIIEDKKYVEADGAKIKSEIPTGSSKNMLAIPTSMDISI